MPCRLTDTDIWKKQKWFKKLPILYKLAWRYLTDCCDHAGIWKIDIPELLDDLGEENFDLQDFIAHCNNDYDKKTGKVICRQRVIQFNEDHLWITGFIVFQYGKNGEVTENFGAARSAIKQLQSLGLYEQAIESKFFIHIFPEKTAKPKPKEKDPPEPSDTLPNPPEPSETVRDAISISNSLSISKNNSSLEEVSKGNTGTNLSRKREDEVFDLTGIKLNGKTLEAAEMNQFTMTKQRNTDFINSQWTIFLLERSNDEWIQQRDYFKHHAKLYSHFLNWIRTKKPPQNGTHQQPIINSNQAGSKSDFRTNTFANTGLAGKTGNSGRPQN